MNVYLAGVDYKNKTSGPGLRTELFFQGCLNVCKGCFNESAKTLEGGIMVPVKDVIQMVADEGNALVTICGGEPFLQIEALYELLSDFFSRGYHVVCYTGLHYEDLLHYAHGGACPSYLIEYTDKQLGMLRSILRHGLINTLIDGPFIEELKNPYDECGYIGSSNQREINVHKAWIDSMHEFTEGSH